MRHLTFLFCIFLSLSAASQNVEIDLPNQSADSLSVGSFHISIDTIKKDLEVVYSDYYRAGVHHQHRRYQTSLYELDTVALFYTLDSTQYEIRFLMCDGREFEIDDPYKGELRYNFLNKKMLRLGYWKRGEVENELASVVDLVNQYIPKKEVCNSKRDLRLFVGHHYLTGRSGEGVYSSGIQMPSLDGSNSIMSRHAAVQKHMEECLPEIKGEQVIKLSFNVDENGEVFDPFCFDCTKDLRSKIYDCISQTNWVPGKNDGENIKVECVVLLGFNVDDKYAYFEQKSKEPPEVIKREPVYIPDEVFGMGSSDEEEVFKVVEQMPEPPTEDYFEKIIGRTKKAFPDKELNEIFQFVVEKDGSISNIKCLKFTDTLVKDFITANIRNSEKFTPGKQRGKAVRVEVTYRVRS